MKILFLTDDYAWSVFGVKRSLYEALRRRAPTGIIFFHGPHPEATFGPRIRRIGEGYLFNRAMEDESTHVFFASSGLAFEPHLMEKLRRRKVLVGFGFSDPRYVEFAKGHWTSFDHYFTLSSRVRDEARAAGVDAHVMLPSVHPGFHDCWHVDPARAEFDVVFLGNVKTHPDADLRRSALARLSERGVRLCVIGAGGNVGHLEGEALVSQLARARIGLNVMGPDSTLPHRLFEYAAVGLCLVSAVTPEIAEAFEAGEEIVPYTPGAVTALLDEPDRCARIAEQGYRRCMGTHTMEDRVRSILAALGQRAGDWKGHRQTAAERSAVHAGTGRTP